MFLVALHLLKNGDKQDDESPLSSSHSSVGGPPQSSNRLRQNALLMLCEMNPGQVSFKPVLILNRNKNVIVT